MCALIRPKDKKLYIAWLGDSQAALVSEGRVQQMVKPHKPNRQVGVFFSLHICAEFNLKLQMYLFEFFKKNLR